MATKQQALSALSRHCNKASLIMDEDGQGYRALIEAPEGFHWKNDVHCRCVNFWYRGAPKSEYWDLVIEEIRLLPKAVKCSDDDCEGIMDFGECDYWKD